MVPLNPESLLDLPLIAADDATATPPDAQVEVLRLFDGHAPSLLRYARSFGISIEEAEDVVQDVFLALFRHLRLERSRRNLAAWLYQVTHNLALKQCRRIARTPHASFDDEVHQAVDPARDPEGVLTERQRRQRLAPVLRALPARDRRCLLLRAEGLRYRDIAGTVGMSLGWVAKSLTRSLARLVNADKG
jgi:RNA polymerase sigma-70 factor (ECF subfamily)